LIEVLLDYNICDFVTCFAIGNATNNDKILRLLTRSLEIDPVKRQLRCAGHILNLVCKAILYGVDEDCIARVLDEGAPVDLADASGVTTFVGIFRTDDEPGRLEAWRKKGPIGRLHNLVVHIKDNSNRRLVFESKQREATGDDGAKLYRVVLNSGIRWNSTYEMVHLALKLKNALTLYQDHYIADRSLDSSDQSLRTTGSSLANYTGSSNLFTRLRSAYSPSRGLMRCQVHCTRHYRLWTTSSQSLRLREMPLHTCHPTTSKLSST
jgi:hypothetical protein